MQVPSGSNGGGRFEVNGQQVSGNFSRPITTTGINDLTDLSALNASSLKITAGDQIDPTASSNVAMVGVDLASKNSLKAGSTFTAYGKTITVVGIFDAGNSFANAGLVMPIKTVQTLSGQAGSIDSVIVQVDSIDNLSSVSGAITNKLGSSTVDVTSSQEQANNAIAPLQNIKTISLYSLIGSLVAGAVIILLTMVMIVRERRREIGVLKAIGASNLIIVSQFVVESLVLTLISSILGIILGLVLSNPILKVLVTNSQSSTTTTTGPGGFRGAGGAIARFGGNFAGGVGNAVNNLHATVGTSLILYGLLAAVVIAIIGSAIPALAIAKVRPAEVMRNDN
jgi:putative ABC transport system permease protein